MYFPHPKESSRTKTRHYHVMVGPEEVNLYNVRGLRYAGPFYDLIFPDAESAVRAWAGVANEIAQVTYSSEKEIHIDEEDIEDLIEEISSHEWSFTYDDDMPNVGYEFGEEGHFVGLSDCGGCMPRSNN